MGSKINLFPSSGNIMHTSPENGLWKPKDHSAVQNYSGLKRLTGANRSQGFAGTFLWFKQKVCV